MILITGANGQLGSEMRELLTQNSIDYIATGVEELDITNKKKVKDYFNKIQPTVVFHCAAYTAVDKAENEGKKANWLINVEGTRNIAEVCQEHHSIFVFISTDYVFDGKKENLQYDVLDKPNPINEYGRAKLEGEKLALNICDRTYVIRTSWVFGKFGKNFVFTMQNLAKKNKSIDVVNDQIGRPTWTRTLGEFMLHLVQTNQEYGIYHLSNDGYCSWYTFALEILKDKTVTINQINSNNFPQVADRPKYSVLDLTKAKNTNFEIPCWKIALSQMLSDK